MIRTFTAVVVSSALVLSAPAMAADGRAQLASVSGTVSVSHAGKVMPALPGALRAGDRVIAKDGEAKLTYADGCVVTLKAQSMATIGESSPCVAPSGLVSAGGSSAQSSWSELSGWEMFVGVLAIGGLVFGIGSLISNENDDPITPVSP